MLYTHTHTHSYRYSHTHLKAQYYSNPLYVLVPSLGNRTILAPAAKPIHHLAPIGWTL